jgi:uncharacterized protein YciW
MELSEAEYAMLEFAEKLTLTPSNMRENDVRKLRDAGWTDRDILDIVHVCAYFNFRVRVVDGLACISHQEKNPAVDNVERGPTPPAMTLFVAQGSCYSGWSRSLNPWS